MLYLLGRIKLFEEVVRQFAHLFDRLGAAVGQSGEQSFPDQEMILLAEAACIASPEGASLVTLRSALIDAIADLAHQLPSLEEDICYERKRLLEEDLAELCRRYWVARQALQNLMDRIPTTGSAKMPKLNPDPFGAELNLGLF